MPVFLSSAYLAGLSAPPAATATTAAAAAAVTESEKDFPSCATTARTTGKNT